MRTNPNTTQPYVNFLQIVLVNWILRLKSLLQSCKAQSRTYTSSFNGVKSPLGHQLMLLNRKFNQDEVSTDSYDLCDPDMFDRFNDPDLPSLHVFVPFASLKKCDQSRKGRRVYRHHSGQCSHIPSKSPWFNAPVLMLAPAPSRKFNASSTEGSLWRH